MAQCVRILQMHVSFLQIWLYESWGLRMQVERRERVLLLLTQVNDAH